MGRPRLQSPKLKPDEATMTSGDWRTHRHDINDHFQHDPLTWSFDALDWLPMLGKMFWLLRCYQARYGQGSLEMRRAKLHLRRRESAAWDCPSLLICQHQHDAFHRWKGQFSSKNLIHQDLKLDGSIGPTCSSWAAAPTQSLLRILEAEL